MRWFTKSVRPAGPGAVLRTRLGLEQLADRAVPSGADPDPTPPPPPPTTDPVLIAPAVQLAPQIVDFGGEEISYGCYHFHGKVLGGPPGGGLVVTFGGGPSLVGQTVTTAADGTFDLTIQVNTDGSDDGMVTAQTMYNGQLSNLAMCDIDPSP